jgi:hypothetical protein
VASANRVMPSTAPPRCRGGGGAPAAVTVKLTSVAGESPPALLQTKEYLYPPGVVGETVCLPLVPTVPVQNPDAVQFVAFTEDQLSVVELPTTIEVAAKVSVGAAGGASTVNVTEFAVDCPTALAQVSE